MMLLGTVIKLALGAHGSFAEEMAEKDSELARQVSAAAEQAGMEPRDFIADTVQRFMAAEDSESWTTIIGNIQRSEDPGFAFVETVIRHRLAHKCSA